MTDWLDHPIINGNTTLIHFDSHPDMMVLRDATSMDAIRILVGNGNFNQLHACTDIASWILPLILARRVREVVWISAAWCGQMDVGRYDRCPFTADTGINLLVGLVPNRIMVAHRTDGDPAERERTLEGCGLYWKSANAWLDDANDLNATPVPMAWTLHVMRLTAAGRLSPSDSAQLQRIIVDSPQWILDIDEDFISCSIWGIVTTIWDML
jgi:hypothetical protein